MKVKLRRDLIGPNAVRYRKHPAGTEIPEGVPLPKDAEVWNGAEFVLASEYDGKVKKGKAVVSNHTRSEEVKTLVGTFEMTDEQHEATALPDAEGSPSHTDKSNKKLRGDPL
jgi:hypothetical protein